MKKYSLQSIFLFSGLLASSAFSQAEAWVADVKIINNTPYAIAITNEGNLASGETWNWTTPDMDDKTELWGSAKLLKGGFYMFSISHLDGVTLQGTPDPQSKQCVEYSINNREVSNTHYGHGSSSIRPNDDFGKRGSLTIVFTDAEQSTMTDSWYGE